MKLADSQIFLRSFPLLVVGGILLLLTVPNPLLVKEENSETKQGSTKIQDKTNDLKTGENSVKVDVNNSIQGTTDNNSQSSPSSGTCKVTKNGVTEIIPASQVNIDEESTEDLNIIVECESKSSSSNQTSVKNEVNIKANSSN
jgi:hypothetical protein